MKKNIGLSIVICCAMTILALAMIGCATGDFVEGFANATLAPLGLAGENDVQERKQNEAAGRGRITNRQVAQQWEANEKAGLGKITDAEVEKERNENESAGRGRITNQQVVQQREANEKAGLGKITDAEVEKERKENEKAGRGSVTNKQIEIAKGKQVAQPFLEKAKSYEQQKQWAYALNSYYHVIQYLDIDPLSTEEAQKKFNLLADSIKSGKPGIGNFNEFALHDEWKKLLMNAEKLGTEYGRDYFYIGKLEKKELDYATKTGTYSSKITISDNLIYKEVIIGVIQAGYKAAWKKDWTDLPNPEYWPSYSVTGSSQGGNFVNGVAIYRSDAKNLWSTYNLNYAPAGWGVYNAFAYRYAGYIHGPMEIGMYTLDTWLAGSLYELSLNIIDENGRELVKPKRAYIFIGYGTDRAPGPYPADNSIEFKGISSALMDKISNGTARVNLVGVYLKYGTYNKKRDANISPEDMVKNFKEIPVPNFRCGYAK